MSLILRKRWPCLRGWGGGMLRCEVCGVVGGVGAGDHRVAEVMELIGSPTSCSDQPLHVPRQEIP